MTSARHKTLFADLEPTAEDFALLAEVAAEVRRRGLLAEEAALASRQAIEAAGAAHEYAQQATSAYRKLCAALAGGAGYERPIELPDALVQAKELLAEPIA